MVTLSGKKWNFPDWYNSRPRLWLSATALVLGWLLYLGNVSNQINQTGDPHLYFAGIYIVFGTLAYRSAKRRKLQLRNDTWYRRVLEIIPIGLIARGFWITPGTIIEIRPFVHFVIPVWVIMAWILVQIDWSKVRLRKDSANHAVDRTTTVSQSATDLPNSQEVPSMPDQDDYEWKNSTRSGPIEPSVQKEKKSPKVSEGIRRFSLVVGVLVALPWTLT